MILDHETEYARRSAALVHSLGEAGAALGFGLSRFLTIRLHLGKAPLPLAPLEPVA